jgi:hypothetical protein
LNKIVAFFLILIIAIFLGSLYGIINDQITYSISAEYYSKFKFIQFGFENWGLGKNIGTLVNPEIILKKPRFGVSIVGFLSTWWFGLFVGIILSFIGFIHKNGKAMFLITIKSILLNLLITVLSGIIGLIYGSLFLIKNKPNWYFPNNLIDVDSFIIVASIHNFSYIGGVIGLIVAIIFTIKKN